MGMMTILASGLDIAFPRTCVLCGSILAPGKEMLPWPVCARCSDALVPSVGERCELCGLPLISERGLCMRCRGEERSFDSAYPLFSYGGRVRDLIAEYKKRRRRSLAPFFASYFSAAIAERWPDRIIVPVPPRPGKLRTSGWDQVEEIARALEGAGIPVERPLVRGRSDEQKRLGRGERGSNARKAYALKPGATPPALPLLIDDVVTTCATLDACARALKEGGALSVRALVFAAD